MFDASRCGLDPISAPGAIQPHGALLAFLADAPMRVTHASANLAAVLGRSPEAVLGEPPEAAFGDAACLTLQQATLWNGAPVNKVHQLPGPGGTPLFLHAHRTGRYICVDIEFESLQPGHMPACILAQPILETFRHANSVEQLCEMAADGLRTITGYDRVVAYRFDRNGDGEVISEARAAHVESFLGLRYPASHVPVLARQLYLRQRVGEIPDTNYQPAQLLVHPMLDDGVPLDLTHSSLRSVAPPHRDYLRKIQVAASLSVALARGPDMWGMLLCHHARPRIAGPNLRMAAKLIGEFVSMRIGELGEIAVRSGFGARSSIVAELVDRLAGTLPLADALTASQAELLGIVDASGVAVRYAGSLHCLGCTPEPDVVEAMLAALIPRSDGSVLAIDDLGNNEAAFTAYADTASGVLLVPLDRANGDAILWFRPESLKTIIWSGNSATDCAVAPTLRTSTDRNTVVPWRQTLRGQCMPWSPSDQRLAVALRSAFNVAMLARARAELAGEVSERQRQRNELERAIDALRSTEAQLNSAETRLERAQEIAGVGSWELNVATGQLLVSKEYCRIAGFSPDDLEPTLDNAFEFTHPDDREAGRRWLGQILAGAPSIPHEAKILRSNGEVRLVRIEGGPVKNQEGEITHVAGTLQDITERRQIERQLAHAQKMEALGSLTGGMAHDFNNMLGIIIVSLELQKRSLTANSVALELCDEALKSAGRCSNLIRSLLAFARRQPLHPKPIKVNALVEDTARLLQRTLGEQIKLSLRLDPKLWPAKVDAAQLEAALVNLATNARDAMPKGGQLDISTSNIHLDALYTELHDDVAAGDYIAIDVSDTGTGIPADIISRIFEPFFTTKEPGIGTGLGLSTSFGFAKQSGGHLSVYSEVGLGSRFRLYLPRAAVDMAASIVAPATRIVEGKGEVVLVVEDNMQLRRAVSRQLTQLGYYVRDAENGDAALEILSGADRVDLLFTDIVMPGATDGVALARQSEALRPGLPILLTSGFPGWGSALHSAGDLQSWRILNKPYSREQLSIALRELITQTSEAPR
jgi:PAS domain S-box-containing protein